MARGPADDDMDGGATIQTTMDDMTNIGAAVAIAVADIRGEEPEELDEVLYDAIDPDALQTLLKNDNTTEISFEFNDCQVDVTSDGQLTVTADA